MKYTFLTLAYFFTSFTFAHALASQTIEVAGSVLTTYGSGNVILTATGGGSGNTIRFSIDPLESECSINDVGGNTVTVTILKAGTCTVYADQNGDAMYDPAPQVAHDIVIKQKELFIAVTAADKIYDGTTHVSLQVSEVGGDVRPGITLSAEGSFTTALPGSNIPVTVSSVTIDGPEKNNYTTHNNMPTGVTASIAKLPVTPILVVNNKVYDGTNAVPERTVCQARTISLQFVVCNYSSATFNDEHIGTGKTVTATGVTFSNPSDAAIFELATTTATGSAAITAIPLTIVGAVHDKTYDGTTSASFSTNIVSGVLAGDTVSVTGGSAQFPSAASGDYTITISGYALTGDQQSRYVLANTTYTDSASILKRPLSITATALDKVYDGEFTASVSFSTDALLGDDVLVSGVGAFTSKYVGSGINVSVSDIRISGSDASNYTYDQTTLSTHASITKQVLTVIPIASDKVYDGTPNATVTFQDDRQNNDNVRVVADVVFSSSSVGSNIPLIVTNERMDGLDAGNYILSIGNGYGTITERPLALTFTVSDKVYDQTTAATITGVTLDGVILGDDVTAINGVATFSDPQAGTGKSVVASNYILSGADAAQYELRTIADTTAAITTKPLTLTVVANSKQFDNTATATLASATLTGVIPGDVVTVRNGTLAFADAAVGASKTVHALGFSLDGASKSNYTVTIPAITASITAVPVVSSGGGGGGGGGGGSATINSCSVTAKPQTIVAGGQTQLTFVSTNGSPLVFEFDGKEYATNGTVTITPTVTTTYKATLKGTTTSCTNTVVVSSTPAVSTLATTGVQGIVLGASVFNFTRDLKLGSRIAPDVTELQKRLAELGFLQSDGVTGYFGQMTFAAVVKYQQSVGINATGYVGPATRVKLQGSSTQQSGRVFGETKFMFNRNFGIGSKLSPDVLELQKILVKKGLLSADNMTGYFGSVTQTAVMQYQTQHNLESVGNIGPRTRAVLNAE